MTRQYKKYLCRQLFYLLHHQHGATVGSFPRIENLSFFQCLAFPSFMAICIHHTVPEMTMLVEIPCLGSQPQAPVCFPHEHPVKTRANVIPATVQIVDFRPAESAGHTFLFSYYDVKIQNSSTKKNLAHILLYFVSNGLSPIASCQINGWHQTSSKSPFRVRTHQLKTTSRS